MPDPIVLAPSGLPTALPLRPVLDIVLYPHFSFGSEPPWYWRTEVIRRFDFESETSHIERVAKALRRPGAVHIRVPAQESPA